MPDEIVEQQVETPEVIEETPKVETDPFFDSAKAKGWKPLEEFDGDPAEWVDAKEFIQRAPLYERMKNQNKKLKEQDKALHDMAAHIDKVAKASYDRAIADLQKEKREAVSVADIDRVEEIDREIIKIRQEIPVRETPKVSPVVTEWVARPENAWFREHEHMATFAINYQEDLFKKHPYMSIEESLQEVGKAVRKEYPDKFSNTARTQPSAVETSAKIVATGKKIYSIKDLNDEQRSIASRFERMGIMSKDEYVKSLAENGLIGA